MHSLLNALGVFLTPLPKPMELLYGGGPHRVGE